MSYTQVKPFNPDKGGTVPNMCLANVVKGYGISNKYDNAWEAWEHTQQHPDHNLPANCDVPVYYSYTTTIDGVKKNYGHINVRLKDGRVWSDGSYYASIEDYEAKKSPNFVGWGESINDVKILQGGTNMDMTAEQCSSAYKKYVNLDIPPQNPACQNRKRDEFFEGLCSSLADGKHLDPQECSNSYKNYANEDIPPTSSACQDRYRGEFYKGLAAQIAENDSDNPLTCTADERAMLDASYRIFGKEI